MFRSFKAGLLATTLSAVALLPAASVVTLSSPTAAFAKGGGNGNGNEGNGGNGNGGQRAGGQGAQKQAHGGGRPEWAGSRGNGGTQGGRGNSGRGGSDPVSDFIRSLTGEERRDARALAREEARAARRAPTEYAPQASIAPGKRPVRTSAMHPSTLGNMNGALNANINAVLAHVRNGNVNGPVGGMAALAVADAALADAQRVVDEAALAEALGEDYATVEDYYAAVVEDEGNRSEAIEDALAALGVSAALEEPYDFTAPSQEDLAAAEAALPDLVVNQAAAEDRLLSLWNKNADNDPNEITPEEDALLATLRGRLEGYDAEIRAATAAADLPATEASEADEEAACDTTDGCDAAPADDADYAAAD